MKDSKFIIIFTIIGLAVAYVVSAPLRRPVNTMPRVGTPLQNMQDMTHPSAAGEPAATAGEGQVYAEGTISLGSGVAAKGRPLFLTVRATEDGKLMGGPPLAAKKIMAPSFPYSFSLTAADNMMGGEFYPGDIALTVRLDGDGIAGPKNPGDTEVVALVKASQSRQLKITLQ